MKILLDTSFILNCIKFKIDFKHELLGHDLYITKSVIEELQELAQGRGAHAAFARIGLKLVSSLQLVQEPEQFAGDVDGVLLELSKQGYCIATQDNVLKRKILKNSGHVVIIRQKKRLEIL